MGRVTQPLPVLLLTSLLGRAWAGGVHLGTPGLVDRPTQSIRSSLEIQGVVKGLKLIPRHGRAVPLPLPHPRALAEGLWVPEGDWAAVILEIDGPVTIHTPEGVRSLSVETLELPLVEPEGAVPRRLLVDLALPEDAATLPEDALLRALQDGALLVDAP